jgi:hypothetical protein
MFQTHFISIHEIDHQTAHTQCFDNPARFCPYQTIFREKNTVTIPLIANNNVWSNLTELPVRISLSQTLTV